MLLGHSVIAHHHHQDDTTVAVEISSKHHHTNSKQEEHSHKSPVEKDHNIPSENQHDHDFPQHYHISVTNDFDYLRTNLQQSNNQSKKESLNPTFIFFQCDYFEQSLDPPIKRNGNHSILMLLFTPKVQLP